MPKNIGDVAASALLRLFISARTISAVGVIYLLPRPPLPTERNVRSPWLPCPLNEYGTRLLTNGSLHPRELTIHRRSLRSLQQRGLASQQQCDDRWIVTDRGRWALALILRPGSPADLCTRSISLGCELRRYVAYRLTPYRRDPAAVGYGAEGSWTRVLDPAARVPRYFGEFK